MFPIYYVTIVIIEKVKIMFCFRANLKRIENALKHVSIKTSYASDWYTYLTVLNTVPWVYIRQRATNCYVILILETVGGIHKINIVGES